jgi:SAM-dependent methyltransferase
MTTLDQTADQTAEQTTSESTPSAVDPDDVMGFVLRSVEEVGATLNCALVVMGDKLGYYRSLAAHGPSTPSELAERTGTDEHYAREWLNSQAAGSIVTYLADSGRYELPPAHAVALTDTTSPAYIVGLFQIAFGTVQSATRITEAARTGDGLGWHDHTADVHTGCEWFFRPSYEAYIADQWLPSLDGVADKLAAGTRVVDIGCGHGASTIVMARAFPRSSFLGIDSHDDSIAIARQRAREAGVEDRVRFEVSSATALAGEKVELVTTFDALHDMGDPVGAARQVHSLLEPDGTWMIVEPVAGDRVEDNLHPVGRAYYGFSTLLCTPCSLSQDVGLALGTQAGPARIRDVVTTAGFSRFELASQTPFNNVFGARP